MPKHFKPEILQRLNIRWISPDCGPFSVRDPQMAAELGAQAVKLHGQNRKERS
jgi:hypothetical protein